MEAIEYLSGEKQYCDRVLYPAPGFLLLDINMPRKNGFEVLEWLSRNVIPRPVPVIMLTSSTVKTDIDKARALGAKAYLVKPVLMETLKQLFTEPEEFLLAHPL